MLRAKKITISPKPVIPATMTRADIARDLNISERLAHSLLHDPLDPIPSFRVGNKLIRVRRVDFDAWVAKRMQDQSAVDRIFNEVLGS